MPSMNLSELSGRERVEQFVQKYVHYSVLHQTCSDRLRALGRGHFANTYNEARDEWLSDPSNPLFELPQHEKQKREICLAKCDRICQTEPKTVREITFACWAGVRLISSGEFGDLANKSKIMDRINQLVAEEYSKHNVHVKSSSKMLDAIESTLPSRLVDAMYPRHTTSGRAKGGELGPHLVGQTIRFRDQKTDSVAPSRTAGRVTLEENGLRLSVALPRNHSRSARES